RLLAEVSWRLPRTVTHAYTPQPSTRTLSAPPPTRLCGILTPFEHPALSTPHLHAVRLSTP
ncbi:unnamed protein product, partial [Citrullus colocynthis]